MAKQNTLRTVKFGALHAHKNRLKYGVLQTRFRHSAFVNLAVASSYGSACSKNSNVHYHNRLGFDKEQGPTVPMRSRADGVVTDFGRQP